MSFHEAYAPSGGGTRLRTGGMAVQRACACGNHAGGGECEACRRRRLLQRKDRGTAVPVSRAAAAGSRGGGVDGGFRAVAPRARAAAAALHTAPRVQRQPLGESLAPAAEAAPAVETAPEAAPAVETAPEAAPETTPEAAPETTPTAAPEAAAPAQAAGLIVDDAAGELQPGQLRKSAFLDQLEAAVCAQADAALAPTGRSSDGCPYLARAFGFYRGQDAAHVEAALRRYAPETRAAATAAETIPLVAARVRQGVERWAATGEVSGVPEDVPGGMALGGLGGVAAGIGGMLFKAREGGARPGDPAAVQAELGAGQPLDGAVRRRLEPAFGQSFAHVRTHTDGTARRLSTEQNARAFTVGPHVAFGAGEYRPGTVLGDALIAHELAHVVQQDGGGGSVAPLAVGGARYDALEKDADEAAAGAVGSLWGGAKAGVAGVAANAVPRLRSGLGLQRCSNDQNKTPKGTDLASLCDDPKCLKRSGCTGDDCKAEAKLITDTYVKRVAAIKRPDLPNHGDVHWGWMCYQWAGLLKREFEKMSTKCWQIRWVGIVSDSSGALEHNYIFTSLGPASNDKGPVRDCGMILDPWRTGNPEVYGGEWNWHQWNYIHDTRDDTGQVYKDGKWTKVTYPPPWTPDEPAPRAP